MSKDKEIIDFGLDFNIDAPEEADDKFRVIPKIEYVPEWEAEVARYMIVGGSLPHNTTLHKHLDIPRDLDKNRFKIWATEEIRRCREGHNGMVGKMYFFYHYCYIQGQKKKIRPNYRVIDAEWFKFIEACQKSNEWGIICVKRRRVGASWKEAADVLHDCLFNTNFNVGMNSKSERDSISLFNKVKFLYENLPAFLRVPTTKSNTKTFLDFSYTVKDAQGNKTTKGNLSTILAVAPTDNAYEGQMLAKWICDEAGKIKNLATLWQYTEDCLMQETRRVGMPVIFGTAGDIGAEGRDLEYMWRNAHQYKLKKFFFSGWMGLNCDQYGNDDKEECIRWIVYERHRREGLRVEELNTFIQKYPLTVPEAFTVTTSAGVGNVIKIKAQQHSLREDPPKSGKGRFKLSPNGKVSWVPDSQGKCIIYEHPQENIESLYVGGADPADHNDTFDEVSDLCLYIMKRRQGTEPPRIVLEYLDRPGDVTEFYEQALMASLYYNKAKLLIERNRYGMINFFEKSEYKYLLARTPKGIVRVNGGKTMTYGVQMTPANKAYLKELIAKYVEDDYEFIPSYELLEEFMYFGARNTDRAMAFGIALMCLEDYNTPIFTSKQKLSKVPHFSYRKVNGRIIRVIHPLD
jgi:hypothetical protein